MITTANYFKLFLRSKITHIITLNYSKNRVKLEKYNYNLTNEFS